MDRSWSFKAAVIVVITVVAVWLLVPSYYANVVLPPEKRNDQAALEAALPAWAPPARFKLNLGLDLQGGIHMVMNVDTRTALQKRVERRAGQVENFLKDKKLEVTATPHPEDLRLVIAPKDPATLEAVEKEVTSYYGDLDLVSKENNQITYSLNDARITQFQEEALDQAMLIIRRRIDKWGVAEADIRKRGTDAIQISLPGAEDPEQAKQLIGTTAQLEFKLVAQNQGSFFADLAQKTPPPAGITLSGEQLEGADREALLAFVKDKAPTGQRVHLECVPDPVKADACRTYRTWLLEARAAVTGDSLTGADYFPGQFNEPEVNITFDAAGARDFEQLTADNTGRLMAIVLDEQVQSAPRINEKIPGGRARITIGRLGEEGVKEAQNLALVLKAGALPAPVSIGEIRQVGASLGPELIRKGSLAALVGFILVVIFMIVIYKGSGVVANVALIINGLLMLAALALFNATLTLPGIAGFVLTLGMAVDANVLINERIREELRHGKTVRAAVDQGYDRAFWTIFDANLTSLIAGVVLFFTGTGPIRGFATTLVIGLIASMYTAIVVTRTITTWRIHGRNAQTLSI